MYTWDVAAMYPNLKLAYIVKEIDERIVERIARLKGEERESGDAEGDSHASDDIYARASVCVCTIRGQRQGRGEDILLAEGRDRDRVECER